MIENLSRRLEHERRIGKIPGIKIAIGIKHINHSQFVNDIIFLAGSSLIRVGWFKTILDQFIYCLGGLANSNKCYIYSWNTNAHSLVVSSRILQFS